MKYFIANWKMNGNHHDLKRYCMSLLENEIYSASAEKIILSVPAIYMSAAYELLKDSNIALSAQCVSEHDKGAFTGQISARMYAEYGCKYALIGHSERRDIEDIKSTQNQIQQCLKEGLTPILCVGETLEEKKASETLAVLNTQLTPLFTSENYGKDIWVAYEPRWAIGSGLTPDNKEINIIAEWFRKKSATKLIYGGSVTPKNIQSLIECDIDGLLVGGASLNYDLTNQMVEICTLYS